jgi:hypothetical protein
MANVTVTEAAAFIPEIWAATALGRLKARTVMAQLVNRNFENEVARFGDIVNVPVRGTLAVNNKAANTVVTLQTPSATTLPLTLNKHKEVSFIVEDIVRAQANQDIIQGYIDDAVGAIAEQVDTDILALYAGFSTTPINATTGGGGVVAATITEARRLLNAAKAPQDNRYIVWHEDAEAALLNNDKLTSAEFGDSGSAVSEAVMGRKYGFTHLMSQLVPTATSETKNLAFHRDAIMMATRPLPPPPPDTGARGVTMNEGGLSIRVIYAYNASHLGVQVTLDILYGVAELRDNHAIVIRGTEGA